MSYESAPSTQMLATHCCACGRPLRDAQSVEYGIGPICAEKYGFLVEMPEDARAVANKIIHRASCERRLRDADRDALISLGFKRLALRLAEVLEGAQRVSVRREGESYVISTPYHDMALVDWRNLRKRYRGRWDRERKVNVIPATSEARRQIWGLITLHFAGGVLETDQGESIIPAV